MMIEICVFGYETFWMRARRIHFWVWILHLVLAVRLCARDVYVCVHVECACGCLPTVFIWISLSLFQQHQRRQRRWWCYFFGWHHYGPCYTIEGAHSLHIHTPRSSRSVHPIETGKKIENNIIIAYKTFAAWKHCHYANCCQTAHTQYTF